MGVSWITIIAVPAGIVLIVLIWLVAGRGARD